MNSRRVIRQRLRVACAASVVVAALSAAGSASAATTLLVPQQYPTIQAAIDAAVDGDTVLVSPGTYLERIDSKVKDITIESVAGRDVTIIDGGGLSPVVTLLAKESQSPVLRGFTVRGADDFPGNGIETSGGPALIEDNLITGNAGCAGRGIEASFSAATIRRNLITGNGATLCSGSPGGGVYVRGVGTAKVIDNVITNNGTRSGEGGGISLGGAGAVTVSGNLISGNTAWNYGGGMAIGGDASGAAIENNVIVGNSPGGIYASVPFGSLGMKIVNNTVASNQVAWGVYIFGFPENVLLANNILVGSTSTSMLECGSISPSQPPQVAFNDVVNAGSGPRYGGTCADQTGLNGNISSDPLFVDPANGDFHLKPGSPAVDAGTSTDAPEFDVDGDARPLDGNGDGTALVDLGADELLLLDSTPPVLSVPSGLVVDATSPSGAVVTYSATATDNLDPSPAVACSPPSGSTFAIGTTTVACAATDAFGNSAAASFKVQVKGAADQLEDLIGFVEDQQLKVGPRLLDKLGLAAHYVRDEDTQRACAALDSFLEIVHRQAGRGIPSEVAGRLSADATRIQTVLGC